MTEVAEERIRVLIVDDFAETRENLRKLLQFESDIVVVGAAGSGHEAIEVASETKPDIVLMDINMEDMDGITATEAILSEVPFTQVIILSVQSEQDYMRRAMMAGARDFMVKPPSSEELIATIRRLSVFARDKRKEFEKPAAADVAELPPGAAGYDSSHRPAGTVLAFYSPKGGVGCTTIATNIALGLDTEETPTVLVDGNLQFGDVSVFLNLQSKYSINDLTARMDDIDPEILEDVLLLHESGLRVLAAPPRPEMADEVNADQIRTIIQFLRRHFAYVVVDTASTMDDTTLAILDTADLLIAICTPDIPSIKDARHLFDLLHILEFPTENVCFVLNKMDRKGGISSEAVGENLKREVEAVIPMDERVVTASINKGIPLILSDRSSPQSRAIMQLMGTIKQRLSEAQEQEQEEEVKERPRMLGR
ncbi:MAG: response regulator [Chloroflexi bacterium]|nr:response regulator [Chloroflexota bacterium]